MSIYIAALILAVAVIVLIRHIQGAIDDNKSGANGANLMDYNNDNKSDEPDGAKRFHDKMRKRATDPAYSAFFGNASHHDDD